MRLLINFLLFSVFSYALCSTNDVTSQKVNAYGWFEWFSNTFYKILYIFLVTGIITCSLYNFFVNKLKNGKVSKDQWFDASTGGERYSNLFSFIETSTNDSDFVESGKPIDGELSESENQLRMRLKNTQEEIQVVRKQLAETLDSRAEMESTLALLDKEKISAELQFELDRVEGVVQLEQIRKDNMAVRREIQKILEEKELAEKEANRLELDIKIYKTASVDTEFLEKRLDSAKKEADNLRQEFTALALEKGVNFDELPEQFCLSNHEDMELEKDCSWTAPDLAREYMILD